MPLNEEVRRIMTKNPPVAHPEDTIRDVTNTMLENGVHQMPVVNEVNVLVGMITSHDLWRKGREIDDLDDKQVQDVMTTKVLVITPKDKVGTAAELFMDRRFKMLPVVNLRHELKGVITAFDVIRHTLTREYPRPILYSEVFDEIQAG
ncbi:MAG: CBS domain-containing protein [Saprospiraceae bacterium]|nr:CBS domain-containing protein [Saprospiraceae bacterium]